MPKSIPPRRGAAKRPVKKVAPRKQAFKKSAAKKAVPRAGAKRTGRPAPAKTSTTRKPSAPPRKPATTTPRRPDPSLPPLPWPLEQELSQTAARARVDEAKVAMQKALAAFDRGDFGKAAAEARKAKDAAPRSPSVREALGLIYHARKDYKAAVSELQTFRRLTGSPLQDAAIAECYLVTGRPDKALEILYELKRERVDERAWVDAQLTRARAHEQRGNVDSAVGVLRTLDTDPAISEGNHLRVRYELAEILERAGERQEARILFAKIAVKAPGFRDALDRAR